MEKIFSLIISIITLLGILFVIYNYFKKPQDATETKFAIGEERDKNKATILAQSEAEGKAALLALEVQREKEYNTKKFVELTDRFDKTDEKIEKIGTDINNMNLNLTKQLTKVQTIVEEHLKTK